MIWSSIWAIIGLTIFIPGLNDKLHQPPSSWVRTTARVQSYRIDDIRLFDSCEKQLRLRIVLSYSDKAGRQYTSFLSECTSLRYSVGSMMPIVYNPRAPREIEHVQDPGVTNGLILFSGTIIAGAIASFVRFNRRRRLLEDLPTPANAASVDQT
jgi:hypothetical protein